MERGKDMTKRFACNVNRCKETSVWGGRMFKSVLVLIFHETISVCCPDHILMMSSCLTMAICVCLQVTSHSHAWQHTELRKQLSTFLLTR